MKVGKYEVKVEGQYIYIAVDGYANSYQLKLEDEGLVLDVVSENENEPLTPLFHGTNDEVLICEHCGKPECSLSCDESQM